MAEKLPDSHRDLLDRPLFAHLATVRPDGSPQSNVMWFAWDGDTLRFTHTKSRQKFRNISAEPRIAISVLDPENPYRFVEVRGTVESIVDDTADAAFYQSLQERYGMVYPIPDAAERVILTVRPTSFTAVEGGSVVS